MEAANDGGDDVKYDSCVYRGQRRTYDDMNVFVPRQRIRHLLGSLVNIPVAVKLIFGGKI